MTAPRDEAARSLRWWGFGHLAPLTLVIAGLLVLISAVSGYEIAGRRSPTYVAVAATMLDQPLTVARSQDAGVVDKLARLRLKYAGIVRSDAVVDAAATSARVSRATLASSLVVRVDNGSLLLYVGASGTSSRKTVTLANALADSLSRYVTQEQRTAQIAKSDQVELRVLAPARVAVPVLPTARQKLLSAFGAGLLAFVVLAAVLDVVRRRAR